MVSASMVSWNDIFHCSMRNIIGYIVYSAICQRSGKTEDWHGLIIDALTSETVVFDTGQNIPITWPWSNHSYLCFDFCGDDRTLSDCYPVNWVRIRDLMYINWTMCSIYKSQNRILFIFGTYRCHSRSTNWSFGWCWVSMGPGAYYYCYVHSCWNCMVRH